MRPADLGDSVVGVALVRPGRAGDWFPAERSSGPPERVTLSAVAEPPEIRYVSCGGRELAYEVVGSGTAGFVVCLDIPAHLDLMWTDPAWGQQVDRFGAVWRAAFFQMRGIGQSEPVERLPTLEEQAADIATVMNAVGLPRAQIFGAGATAPGAVMFAAAHPDRVDGLVLLCPFLSGPLADDPDLSGWEPGAARRWAEWWLENADRWGSGVSVDGWDPAIASPRVYRQAALLERTAASRPVAKAYIEAAMRTDVSRIATCRDSAIGSSSPRRAGCRAS